MFLKALRILPDSLLLLLLALAGEGSIAGARRLASSLRARGPGERADLLCLDALLARQGRGGIVQSMLQKVLEAPDGRRSPLPGASRRLRELLVGLLRWHIRHARFEKAIAAAETLLRSSPGGEDIEALFFIPAFDENERELPSDQKRRLLAALEAEPAAGAGAPWRTLLALGLIEGLDGTAAAFARSEPLTRLPRDFQWMRFGRGVALLRVLRDYPAAEKELRIAAEGPPANWKAEACIAEAALCRGEAGRALEGMDRCLSRLSGYDHAQALAWRGEMRLWLGDYRQALADLDEAIRGEARLARCWRGGARLMLGRPEEALHDLDVRLKDSPGDAEAWAWRAEAHRRLGALDAASADAERAARLEEVPVWAWVNRALVRAAQGDEAALASDYARLPERMRTFFEDRLPPPVSTAGSARRMQAVLERMLEAARGLRRSDRYLEPLWMRA